MKNFGSLVAAAVLLAACGWAAADEIKFHNKLTRAGGAALLTVQCRGPAVADCYRTFRVTYDESVKIKMPSNQDLERPGTCYALFRWEGEYFRFVVYTYPRDHLRCAAGCRLEARQDGLYGFNNATRGWDLIARYPIHPLNLQGVNKK